jgi:alginate production protein
MTIARLLCAMAVAATVAGCGTDIGRTQVHGTLGAGTVDGLLGSKIEGSNVQLAMAAVDVPYTELAQFTLPKPAPRGEDPAAKVPKQLKFEYVYGSELEAPFINNLDLDSNVTDDSIILAPTVFGAVTYRPTDWLETRLEGTLEKLIPVHEHELITLPDGSIQTADPTPWSLLIDQVYAKIKLPKVPVELTVGRSLFEDARLWLFDGELDAARLMLKPGDFKIEVSVSREDLFDLELNPNIKFTKGQIDNYVVFAEYRGIEDHKLAGYWILRDDKSDQEGQPQFMGVRAYGRPTDEFRYWTDLGFVRGEDEFSQDLSGYAFEAGGTYRFLDLPLQPSITLGYAYGSGDSDPNDNKNHEYRQTGLQSNEDRFGGVTQFLVYGETLDPELSNLNIYTAGLGLRPAGGAFVDLVYHHYRLNEIATEVRGSPITARMNQIGSQLSKDVGDAFDIVLGFRNLFDVRGLGFEVRGGMFFPGDAFRRDEGGVIKDADMGVTALVVMFI